MKMLSSGVNEARAMRIFFCVLLIAGIVTTLLKHMVNDIRRNELSLNVNMTGSYSSAQLHSMKCLDYKPEFLKDIPEEIKKVSRRRGRRGGVRARIRRQGCKIPLPVVSIGNVRSLRNKIDELTALCRYDYNFRTSSVICLTETWLNENDPDSAYEIEGFKLIRSDRNGSDCKSSGGGLITYVKEAWCKDCTVVRTHCDKNLEVAIISLRPYYLPREFSKIIISNVYIPPDGNFSDASKTLHEMLQSTENSSIDSVNIICGDFNKCDFSKYIPHYYQFVHCPTREENILDLCYCNIKGSYVAKQRPPLSTSDHKMLHMVPKYRQKIKQSKPEKKTIRLWDQGTNDQLQACFECTDWNVLVDDTETIDRNVDVITSYINFCTDNIVCKKEVVCYPNNKPWVTKDLKTQLNLKRKYQREKDRENLKNIQREIRRDIAICKKNYKDKVEKLFKEKDAKSAWKGLRILTSSEKKKSKAQPENTLQFCNDMNQFFTRFDKFDFTTECKTLLDSLSLQNSTRIVISERDVERTLKAVKIGKAAGPDKINGKVLKLCAQTLAPIFTQIFQKSMDTNKIPTEWKTSEIVPIPKRDPPVVNNDWRPVALTDIIMKCFEKIVKKLLLEQTHGNLDPLQFAYTANRSVEDPTLCMTNDILRHLDEPSKPDSHKFAKILFIDFSSAFNTVQPYLMIQKLKDMNVNAYLIHWLYEFLTGRSQYVRFNDCVSNMLVTNTGAPQGCVLSPILFVLYTSDCKASYQNCMIYKYADDTALVSLCENSDKDYRKEVTNFTEWCANNYLELNVGKTKEMVIDFTKRTVVHRDLEIDGKKVERVDKYKYLGTIIDSKFKFEENITTLYKRANKRMYHLRQLHHLKVDRTIVKLFYMSIIESVIIFCICLWFGNGAEHIKCRLERIVKMCQKLGLADLPSCKDLYRKNVLRQCRKIREDVTHPLHKFYVTLPSGRRIRSVPARTERYRLSFVPHSIRISNSN